MLHLVEPTGRPVLPTPGYAPAGRAGDEAVRRAMLQHYEILDTPPEAAFDRIAALAARLFDAPISIIGFFDRDRLWFKSHYGLVETEVMRTPGAALSTSNPLFGRNVAPGFFASVPLCTSDGYDIGILCVIDRQPRNADEPLVRHLKTLADIVMDQLELRLFIRRDAASASLPTPLGSVGTTDVKARFSHLTPRQHEILRLVVAGRPSKIIAADLGISRRTVENHRAAIMKRTGATSLPALAHLALLAAGIGARELLELVSVSGSVVV